MFNSLSDVCMKTRSMLTSHILIYQQDFGGSYKPFHSFAEVFGHKKHLEHAVQIACQTWTVQAKVICGFH